MKTLTEPRGLAGAQSVWLGMELEDDSVRASGQVNLECGQRRWRKNRGDQGVSSVLIRTDVASGSEAPNPLQGVQTAKPHLAHLTRGRRVMT